MHIINRRKPDMAKLLMSVLLMILCAGANADLVLDNKWSSGFTPEGRLMPRDQYEPSIMGDALDKAAEARSTESIAQKGIDHDPGYRLFVDGVKYYYGGEMFMTKSTPDEVCTPDFSKGELLYLCKEGQRETRACHAIFLNSDYQAVGFHTININAPFKYFCNAMPAVGVRDKVRNDLLLTVQYFNIDGAHAKTVDDIGMGWRRMTVLLHIKAVDGKIEVEQDDQCLGNPNTIETIPDARKKLKACSAN